eukprot:g28846.t1
MSDRSVSFANGKDYSRDRDGRLFDVTLSKDPTGPATTCTSCGNVFMPDSEFCRKCGVKREMSMKPDRFGFANVPVQDGRSLQITWIDPSGLLARWNTLHPNSEVKEGQIIVAVNGVSEDVEAMRLQLQMNSIQMSLKASRTEGAPEHREGEGEHLLGVGRHGATEGWRRRVPKADTNQALMRGQKQPGWRCGTTAAWGSEVQSQGACRCRAWANGLLHVPFWPTAADQSRNPKGTQHLAILASQSRGSLFPCVFRCPRTNGLEMSFTSLFSMMHLYPCRQGNLHQSPWGMSAKVLSCEARVKVPEGVKPGEKIVFPGPHGYNLEAVVPEGKEPGDEFHVALPAPPPEQPSSFLLTVPDGKKGGDELFFDANGQHMRAIIPEGERHSEAKKLVAASNLNVNGTFDQGFTPLFYAATSGAFEVAKWLVEDPNLSRERADVNASNETKRTPLHWASRNGHIKVVELLLGARAAMNGPDGTGRNPLALAIGYKQTEVVELLRKAGAEAGQLTRDVSEMSDGGINMSEMTMAADPAPDAEEGKPTRVLHEGPMPRHVWESRSPPRWRWCGMHLEDGNELVHRAARRMEGLRLCPPTLERSRFEEETNLWHVVMFGASTWIGRLQDLAFAFWNWTMISLWKGPWYARPVALTIVCLGALPFCFVYAGPWEMRWCCEKYLMHMPEGILILHQLKVAHEVFGRKLSPEAVAEMEAFMEWKDANL